MQKTNTSAENQLVPPPSSFHDHIIGLTRSPTLQCDLYTSCSSKDQNSETNWKSRERRPVDRIYHLCHGSQRTRMPKSVLSTAKPHRVASKGCRSHHRTPGIICHATASLTGTDLFPLGEISNIGQPVGHPDRECNVLV
jgi:hypothetical protein